MEPVYGTLEPDVPSQRSTPSRVAPPPVLTQGSAENLYGVPLATNSPQIVRRATLSPTGGLLAASVEAPTLAENLLSASAEMDHTVATKSIIPDGDLKEIGWAGDMSREQAETLLRRDRRQGAFLMRFSANSGTYVLSFWKDDQVRHIGYIQPEDGGRITVLKTDNTSKAYASLHAYVAAMKRSGLIALPFHNPAAGSLYSDFE